MENNDFTYLEIKVYGRVQGVAFRYFAKKWADNLNIKGFCRNENDGTVLIVSSGTKENQEKFLEKLQKGPLFARVDKIEVKETEKINSEKFQINP